MSSYPMLYITLVVCIYISGCSATVKKFFPYLLSLHILRNLLQLRGLRCHFVVIFLDLTLKVFEIYILAELQC